MTSDPGITSSNNELDEEQSQHPNSSDPMGYEGSGSGNFSSSPSLLAQLKTRVQEHGQLVEKRSTLSMRMDQQLAAMNNALKTEREANHELANMQVEWEDVTEYLHHYESIEIGVDALRQEPENPRENPRQEFEHPPQAAHGLSLAADTESNATTSSSLANSAVNQESGGHQPVVPAVDPVQLTVLSWLRSTHDRMINVGQNQVDMCDWVNENIQSLRSMRDALVPIFRAVRRRAEEAKAKAEAETNTYKQVVEELANTDRDIAACRAQIIELRSFCDGAMRLCVLTSPRALLERPRDIYESISSDPLPAADEPLTQSSDLAE